MVQRCATACRSAVRITRKRHRQRLPHAASTTRHATRTQPALAPGSRVGPATQRLPLTHIHSIIAMKNTWE